MTPFPKSSEVEKQWFEDYVNGTIDAASFDLFQDRLKEDKELRMTFRRYLALDDHLQRSLESNHDTAMKPWLEVEKPIDIRPGRKWLPLAAAACAFLLGAVAMLWQGNREERDESLAEGFAVVGRLFDTAWREGARAYREGDTLGAESFFLTQGTAEIIFFSGAVMTVQGPAEIYLKSAWEAECRNGVVRMRVPPAARGFKLQAPATEIVDLGTEFGLKVQDGKSYAEVFDGEISIRHENEVTRLVKKGEAWELPSKEPASQVESGRVAFQEVAQLDSRAIEQRQTDYAHWKDHRDSLSRDSRVIAYYTFGGEASGSVVPNIAVPENHNYDGFSILAESVHGRWPGLKSAREFRRPGARIRVNLPGEFSAFTFMCWVRIDSLDRWYNALFMGDGYETGEPHWQIRDDGKLMLSVMVNDSPEGASRLHRVYFSPPFWDLSMSGQWVHLASVYDPARRLVSHFVNGEEIDRQEIIPKYYIKTLRIGNGEIGNWGEPFRENPKFAIRNLNGRMDELAIFKAALSGREIREFYDRSRSNSR